MKKIAHVTCPRAIPCREAAPAYLRDPTLSERGGGGAPPVKVHKVNDAANVYSCSVNSISELLSSLPGRNRHRYRNGVVQLSIT